MPTDDRRRATRAIVDAACRSAGWASSPLHAGACAIDGAASQAERCAGDRARRVARRRAIRAATIGRSAPVVASRDARRAARSALTIAARRARGEPRAERSLEATLARIDARSTRAQRASPTCTAERARAKPRAIDARARGEAPLPPLAGVPYAVKNLFDIEGAATLAGSKIDARQAARARATPRSCARMQAAGAVLVGTLNMDEFAYGFTTENTHYGPTRNPHDLDAHRRRLVGRLGRGGRGAAGAVDARLGHQRLDPRAVVAVRRVGPEADVRPPAARRQLPVRREPRSPRARSPRSVRDLAAAYDAMQGADAHDPGCAQRAVGAGARARSARGLAAACASRVLGGYFDEHAGAEARARGRTRVPRRWARPRRRSARGARGARGGIRHHRARRRALHLPRPARRAHDDFEPLSRDRFVAGACCPRRGTCRRSACGAVPRRRCARCSSDYDVLLAPATPCAATPIGAEWIEHQRPALPCAAEHGLADAADLVHRAAGVRGAAVARARRACRSACR